MVERLQKILSRCSVASRRAAEELILRGCVTVNGCPACPGMKADPTVDRILVNGEPISLPGKSVYIMLNKPRGFVTTLSDEKGRPTVRDLVRDCGAHVYPVGRLDLNSEGLLILTNDGDAAHRLMHPSGRVPKEYLIRVRGDVPAALPLLRGPMSLDGELLSPALVRLKPGNESGSALLSITIREGKNRQVRRMCKASGLDVLRLKRVREGDLILGGLESGQWRYLTEKEIEYVKGD